jgi:hypothetical protein
LPWVIVALLPGTYALIALCVLLLILLAQMYQLWAIDKEAESKLPAAIAMAQRIAENPLPEGLEPFAAAYDFDGYGHRYTDNGDGGNYAAKMLEPDTIPLYTPERMTEIFERALSHVERGTEPRTNYQPTKI